jgi:hypothetical protein
MDSETSYYVTHPNLAQTALVHAPSTDKARTVFLDWLERNFIISRSDRQKWRRNMVAAKMEDPVEVGAEVELWYGYEGHSRSAPDILSDYTAPPEIVPTRASTGLPIEELEEEVSSDIPVRQPMSPVAKISLGGFA